MHMEGGVLFSKRLIKLLKEFSLQNELTPDEFIETKLERNNNAYFTELCENFLKFMRHYDFLEMVVQNYWSHYGLKPFNKEIIATLIYVIIFALDDENVSQTIEIFTKLNYRFSLNVIDYFMEESNVIIITQAGCKKFDNQYVLENILHPILNKKTLIEKIQSEVRTEVSLKHKIDIKPPTRSIAPACFNNYKRISAPPLNTPIEVNSFKSRKVPEVVLKGSTETKECLEKARQKNREKALQLLQFAQNKAFKCANTTKKPTPPVESPTFLFKPTKVPTKKDVEIKRNAASVMREAATLVKDKDSEIKKIEALTQAVFDPSALEVLEEDIRKCREQQNLQDIERKHLQGQLTYEEAILAKQNLIKANQEKMEEFKQERICILEEIERWREEEQEKIRKLVEKCQNVEKAMKEAERKMQEDKKVQARSVQAETKQMLREAFLRKQEELACRVRLIQELRALQQLRSAHAKEFDPTESPNFGLLCEMSIAELQERLGLLRLELREELERRRRAVADSRRRQQQLIESAKEFIGQSRITKPKPVPRSSCKLEQTPEIIALRERLQQAKQLRIATQLNARVL